MGSCMPKYVWKSGHFADVSSFPGSCKPQIAKSVQQAWLQIPLPAKHLSCLGIEHSLQMH